LLSLCALAAWGCTAICDIEELEQLARKAMWCDEESGLCWQERVSDSRRDWGEAGEYCEDLDYAGKKDWRLPTISELRTAIRGCPATDPGGGCGVSDDCTAMSCWNSACDGCLYGQGEGENGCYWEDEFEGECAPGDVYWSDSSVGDGIAVWAHEPLSGSINWAEFTSERLVRCVRDAD
jgi:hypothetical protein